MKIAHLPVSRLRRADATFPQALQALLDSPGREARSAVRARTSRAAGERVTLNALAARVGVRQSHLWRIVHRPEERRASLELIARVAEALELPADYFLETRMAAVDDYLRSHPARLNRLYAEARRSAIPEAGDPSE